MQKTYCTDYIKRTFVVNDGSEIPKYYAQNSHPAIVDAEVFDLTQDELEKAFVSVMQKVLSEKEIIFTVCREVLDEALDTAELDRVATQLPDQALGMAEHEKLGEKIRAVEAQKKDKADRRRQIEVFLCMLEEQEECVDCDAYTFAALIDRVGRWTRQKTDICLPKWNEI